VSSADKSCSMIRILKVIALLVFVFAASSNLSAQSKSPLSEIKSYTAEVDRFVKITKKHRIFADVSTEDDKNEIWKEFKNKKELEDSEAYTQAFVWTKAGKVIAANFMFTSPSGDWAQYINYYFRADGTVAKIAAELNTFYGDISVIRDRYYNSDGKLVKSTRKFLDLKTRKPKKQTDVMIETVPIYTKVSALPFHKFL